MFTLKDDKQKLSGVIADSFTLLKSCWAPNIAVVLIAIVACIIVGLVVDAFAGSHFMQAALLLKTTKSVDSTHLMVLLSAEPIIKSIFAFLVGLFFIAWIFRIMNAVIVRACWNAATLGSAKLSNAFKVGLKYFYVYLVQLIAVIVLAVLMGVIQYLFGKIGLHWLNVLVVILTQILFFYVFVKILLVDASAVIEDCGMKGFVHAWCLTSGNWWRTVFSLVFSVVFYMIVVYLIGMGIFWLIFSPAIHPIFSMSMLGMFKSASPLWFSILFSIFAALTALTIIFTTPSMVGSNETVLYNDLKKRRV